MKHSITFLFLLGILGSCESPNSSNINEEVRVNTNQLVQSLMSLWESGDTLMTQEIFLTECEYVDVANNYTFTGIVGVNKYVGHIHSWASDVKMITRKINTTENMGYVEWTLKAKHTSPIEGRVPIATNKDITLNGVTLLEFKDGKIEKASDYMDVLGFVMQLGSKVELPGGVVIGSDDNTSQ